MPEPARSAQTALVIGEYRQTVTVVRSLARAGLRVTFACAEPDSPTRFSRHVSSVWIYDWTRAEGFAEQLESYLGTCPHDFVFTVGESPLRRMIAAAPRLEPLATWVNPDPATIARCFDKCAIYELTHSLGIPTPPWRRFTGRDDWQAAAREMGFPVVVKRVDSSADVQGHKAIICRTDAQFDAFLSTLAAEPDPASLVLQKHQRGVRHNCHVAFADGRLVAYFQQRVLTTDEPDGTGIGTAGISVPPCSRLRSHCERLGAALRYTGIGCIQFLVDDDSADAGFLEFNARMDSTAALPYRLGYDYPLLAVRLAQFRRGLGPPPEAVTRAYRVGETYHWLLGDLWALIGDVRARRMPAAALAARAFGMARLALTSRHLTFEWRDPLPTLHMYWQHLGRRVVRRLHAAPVNVGTG